MCIRECKQIHCCYCCSDQQTPNFTGRDTTTEFTERAPGTKYQVNGKAAAPTLSINGSSYYCPPDGRNVAVAEGASIWKSTAFLHLHHQLCSPAPSQGPIGCTRTWSEVGVARGGSIGSYEKTQKKAREVGE